MKPTQGRNKQIPKPFWILGLFALISVLLPIVSLIAHTDFSRFVNDIVQKDTLDALKVSILSSTIIALCALLLGTPFAFLISRAPKIFSRLVRPLIISALVFPPTVAGLALIALLGPESFIGRFLYSTFEFKFEGTLVGVVLAGFFVGAPFLVLIAEASIEQLDESLDEAATTEGASPWQVFRFIIAPQILPSLMAGMALTWARAIGEFGATMTFAGSYPGTTLTPSMKIYADLKNDVPAAYSLSTLMIAISFVLIISLQRFWVPTLMRRK